MPAIKSVTEDPDPKLPCAAATAMGDRIHLHESNGEKTSRSDGEELSQRHRRHRTHLKFISGIIGLSGARIRPPWQANNRE